MTPTSKQARSRVTFVRILSTLLVSSVIFAYLIVAHSKIPNEVFSSFQSLYKSFEEADDVCASHFDLLERLHPDWHVNQTFSQSSQADLTDHIKTSFINLRVYNKCFISSTKADPEVSLDARLIPFINHNQYPEYTDATTSKILPIFSNTQGNYWRGLYSKQSGSGVVIGVSGDLKLKSTLKLLRVLKHLENDLPIQIVHAGLSPQSLEALTTAASETNVPITYINVAPSVDLDAGIPIMWYASLFNTFAEMLYMDPDTVPFTKPSTFFALEKYKDRGSYFFKDVKQVNEKLSYETKAFYESLLPSGEVKFQQSLQQHLKNQPHGAPDVRHDTNDRFNDHHRFNGGRQSEFNEPHGGPKDLFSDTGRGGRGHGRGRGRGRGGPGRFGRGGDCDKKGGDNSLHNIFRRRSNNINNGLFIVNRSQNFVSFLAGLTMQSWKHKFAYQKDILWLSHILAGSDFGVNRLFPGITGVVNKEYRVNSICSSHQSYFTDSKPDPELLWIHGDLLGYHNLNSSLSTCEKTLLNIEGAILPSMRPFKDFVQSRYKCNANGDLDLTSDPDQDTLGSSSGNYYCAYIHERFQRRYAGHVGGDIPRKNRVHRLVNFNEDDAKTYNDVVSAWNSVE